MVNDLTSINSTNSLSHSPVTVEKLDRMVTLFWTKCSKNTLHCIYSEACLRSSEAKDNRRLMAFWMRVTSSQALVGYSRRNIAMAIMVLLCRIALLFGREQRQILKLLTLQVKINKSYWTTLQFQGRDVNSSRTLD